MRYIPLRVTEMSFKEQCIQLSKWINKSQGNPIYEVGHDANIFVCHKQITKQEILDFEQLNNVKLPRDYFFFLETVGESDLFIPWGFEVVSPQRYAENAKKIFENYGKDPFPEILMGINTISGEMGGFILDKSKREYNTFALFQAEVPPEFWIKDNCSYESFTSWLIDEVDEILDSYSIE